MFNGYVTDRHRWRDMSHQCVALYETDALDQDVQSCDRDIGHFNYCA